MDLVTGDLKHYAAAAALVFALLSTGPSRAAAQLISPGRLISAHEDMNGIRDCTNCHELRSRGVSDEKCLECHEPLGNRIRERRGFHGIRPLEGCGGCHRDHFGEDFDPVHFDTTGFDHELTGFRLAGSHDSVPCGDCHRAELVVAADVREFRSDPGYLEKTYLGLDTGCVSCHADDDPHDGRYSSLECADCHTESDWNDPEAFDHDDLGPEQTCVSCHTPDDPHGNQFVDRPCDECHTSDVWKPPTRFDHADTRYRLTGAHVSTACDGCHTAAPGGGRVIRYRLNVSRGCISCHEDQHDGRMDGACADCHNTEAWLSIDGEEFESGFDHSRTGFDLVGAHARAECAFCHDPTTEQEQLRLSFPTAVADSRYPRPLAETCMACHRDYHEGTFANTYDGPECDNCHGQDGWLPTSFDIRRHNRDTDFELAGAHAATPCVTCHVRSDNGLETLVFRFDERECADCHGDDDPHNDQFEGRRCVECHNVDQFSIPDFDHSTTRYPLDGAHESVACSSCHVNVLDASGARYVLYTPLGTECKDCHGGGAP